MAPNDDRQGEWLMFTSNSLNPTALAGFYHLENHSFPNFISRDWSKWLYMWIGSSPGWEDSIPGTFPPIMQHSIVTTDRLSIHVRRQWCERRISILLIAVPGYTAHAKDRWRENPASGFFFAARLHLGGVLPKFRATYKIADGSKVDHLLQEQMASTTL